jgi:hypothetical protein
MKFRTRTVRLAAAGVLAALLAACGGGDGSSSLPLTGWAGSTDTNRDLTAVVQSDGTYYLMYSAVGDATTVGGVVQGTSSVAGTQFTSSDALDFSAEGAGIRAATVSATFIPASSFQGGIAPAAGGTTVNFQSQLAQPAGFTPSLAYLAGTYTGTAGFALGVRVATFVVTSGGAVSSSINGCAITGTAQPRIDGNAYDLSLAFGPAPCALPGLAFTGIAYLRPDNGRLYAAARNAATKQSVIFNGARQ